MTMEMIILLTRLGWLPPPTLQGEPGQESQDRSKSKHVYKGIAIDKWVDVMRRSPSLDGQDLGQMGGAKDAE